MSKPKIDNPSVIRLSHVKEGTKLVADDGFTCIPDHAVRVVKRDMSRMRSWSAKTDTFVHEPVSSRSRLYVRCSEGKHFLDGQECGPKEHGAGFDHYIGFWIKGTEPPKEKTT